MAVSSLPASSLPVSTRCSSWQASDEKPVPKLTTPFLFPPRSSTLNCLTRTSTASSFRPGKLRANKTVESRTAISASLEMGQMATAAESAVAPQSELGGDTPTVVEFTIPPESLVGFEADYQRSSARWPADLATTVDDAKIEQFVSSAHALARRWLPEDLVSRLEGFTYDPAESPALVIRGLPIDKDLPPTEPDCHLKKTGKCVSETWLVGISRILGQVFTLENLRGSRPGMGLLVREIYTTPEAVDVVAANGSRELLDFHVDFFQTIPEKFPHVIAFIGVRGDRNKDGKTLLCSNRKLYRMLDPADIHVLRAEKIAWNYGVGQFSHYVIEGSESNPKLNLFEENLPGIGGFEKAVTGSPEARAAYKRVKEIAATLPEGVWLGGGDMLFLNQKKASHGRSPYNAKFDGNDRWLQRTYINSGFWESGLTQWPSRTLPMT